MLPSERGDMLDHLRRGGDAIAIEISECRFEIEGGSIGPPVSTSVPDRRVPARWRFRGETEIGRNCIRLDRALIDPFGHFLGGLDAFGIAVREIGRAVAKQQRKLHQLLHHIYDAVVRLPPMSAWGANQRPSGQR